MKILILTVAALTLAVIGSAEAKARTGHHHRHHFPDAGNMVGQEKFSVCSDPVMRPCRGMSIFSSSSEGRKIKRNNVSRETRRAAPPTLAHHARLPIPAGLAEVLRNGAGRAAGLVRAASGATAHVATAAAGRFQCLVDKLEAQGYPIRFMGGWRAHGSVPGSLHPRGLALDINQYGRNVTRPRMPRNEVALAGACGLISGAQWAHGDSGHFQLGGWAGHPRARYAAKRRHHGARYAHGHRFRPHYASAR